MRISLRIKVISLLFILITSLALVMNEQSTDLIYEKTQETFQQRLELLSESVKSYWESEKNMLLNNAMLYAESEKIINYSTYGLSNLLQQELDRMISKTGFHDMKIRLVNGQIISSSSQKRQKAAPFDLKDTSLNLASIALEQSREGLFLSATVPVQKMGQLIGRLSLRRKLDNTRLKKMARNLQAEVSIGIREKIMATSLIDKAREDLVKQNFRSTDLNKEISHVILDNEAYALKRISFEKTELGEQLYIYIAISQEKMLSMVAQARYQNFRVTVWALLITLLLTVAFSEKVLISRIRAIRDGANLIAEGDLDQQLKVGGKDELGDLAGSFNRMTSNLRQNHERLQHYIEKIESMANYIRNILGSLRTCVITWTMEGRIETANAAAHLELDEFYSKLEGLSLRQFIKKLQPESRRVIIKALREVTRADTDRQFDIELSTGEHGGIKVLQGGFSLLRDYDSKPYGFVLTLSNITQRKIIEQQLYHADKLSSIGQLAASVAHEIKNPLASIKTLGQLLQEEIDADDDNREYIDVIVSEVNRLNSVVEQLLKYARPEGSTFKEQKFKEVIKPVLALVNHEAERNNISLETEYDEDLKVFVDSEKIKQVFLNLVFNGMQAMGKGGSIKIKAFKQPDSLWTAFEVKDSGKGMPEEIRKKVFEPFFTTRQRGTGLGLAIVKKIIDLHGGKIEIYSKAKEGTSVSFHLPSKQKG
jgi:two-component system sensor histidine kinase AtoS